MSASSGNPDQFGERTVIRDYPDYELKPPILFSTLFRRVVFDAVLPEPQCGWEGNKDCASNGNKRTNMGTSVSIPTSYLLNLLLSVTIPAL